MLLTFVLSVICMLINTFITWFIGLIPQIDIPLWSVPASMTNIAAACNYFLPMNAIWACLTVLMGFTMFRIALAVLLRIKSFIPGISGN